MQLILVDDKSSISVSDEVFNIDFNKALIHQVITSYYAGSRQGSKAQKSRAEVSGSGKKPWRQKGTGRARAGSIRSPLWRSGGVTFAAKSKLYIQKVNRKMYRGALKSIFSELIRQKRLMVFKNFSVMYPKTKILLKKIKKLAINDVLIITKKLDNNLFFASRNLHKVFVKDYKSINPLNLINFENTIITSEALKKVEEILI